MTVAGGPHIETSGLVLYYDVNNIDSYPGEPTTNIVANPTPTTSWNVSNYLTSQVTLGYSYEDGIPQIELSNLTTESGYPRLVDSAFTSTLTGVYSISFEAKGTINDNFLFRIYEGGSTKITKSATLTSTGEWEKFTVSSTTAFILTTPYINPVIIAGTLYIRNIQVEAKTHVTPFVNGTRSSTDGLKDLSGQDNHADLTNATYDSNALIDYDGSTGCTLLPTSINTLTEGTISFWFNTSNTSAQYPISFYADSSNYFAIVLGNSTGNWTDESMRVMYRANAVWYYNYAFRNGETFYQDGSWHQCTFKVDSTGNLLYADGVELSVSQWQDSPEGLASTRFLSSLNGTPSGYIGRRDANYFDGKIDQIRIYNRGLTSKEILDNYNAVKSRFGH